ncbi:hypothetical protein EBZ39_13185 [bacterium]|nr:hypothetical protein [bacterium]
MKISAKIKIEGTKPLLFHTFPIDTLDAGKAKKGTTGNDAEEWKNTVLMDGERRLYVYGSYLRACISEGGKHIKVGKGNISKKVGACLEVNGERVFLDDLKVPADKDLTRLNTDKVYLDVRSVVNPMTKGRNLRYRIAAKEGWSLSAIITWDDYVVSKENMKQCVENGGLYDGIGDARKIGFGKFILLSFQILD